MLGDLNADIIGTNPQYPKIVDHGWLDVDLGKYDNFPSDNNPVRVVPKLSDLWNHSPSQTGVNLVPNTRVMPLGIRSSEEDVKAAQQIVREAKKAVMSGLKGKSLSQYLRARFASKHIEMAKDELQKVAQEIGLLGNVYIDASAFNSYRDAEEFLSQHRTRLARDILINSEKMSPNVITMLASSFHRNVVSSVEYNEDLFRKYKNHLVMAGKIPADFIIDSKETLRQAFLYEKSQASAETSVVANDKKTLNAEEIKAGFDKINSDKEIQASEIQDGILMPRISPVVSFVQENLAKGKTSSDLKEMIKGKFVLDDIKVASEGLSIVLSKEGLSDSNIDKFVSEGKISLTLGKELKKIGQKFPVTKKAVENIPQPERQIGVKGYFCTPKATADEFSSVRAIIVEALKKGYDVGSIKAKLQSKVAVEHIDRIVAEAVSQFNSIPAGFTANKSIKAKDAVMISELPSKPTLPDPSTIASQSEEIYKTFQGSEMMVDINPSKDYTPQEIGELFNRTGLDQVIE